MGDGSNIEWTDATWNPIVGCSIVSPGCTNCYAMRTAGARTKHTAKYQGLTQPSKAGPVWTGEVRFWEKALLDPLKWRDPRRVFVNSMGDLFHEDVPDEWIDKCFAVMAMAPQHTYQILTKRAERMRDYIRAKRRLAPQWVDLPSWGARVLLPYEGGWPTFVWLGVSCEDQGRADERIPLLLETPAAVRFISAEPLLGPIRLDRLAHGDESELDALRGQINFTPQHVAVRPRKAAAKLDWVIVGGESGPGARPMNPQWARDLRDQCVAGGISLFFKQWGEYVSVSEVAGPGAHFHFPDGRTVRRTGKKHAGRSLDGRTWDEYPAPRARL